MHCTFSRLDCVSCLTCVVRQVVNCVILLLCNNDSARDRDLMHIAGNNGCERRGAKEKWRVRTEIYGLSNHVALLPGWRLVSLLFTHSPVVDALFGLLTGEVRSEVHLLRFIDVLKGQNRTEALESA